MKSLRLFVSGWVALAGVVQANDLPILSCAEELARTAACVELTSVDISGFRGNRLMLVLRTNGCYFDKGETGCTMCNFKQHSINPRDYRVTHTDLLAQLHREVEKQRQSGRAIHQVDLLTLGNFLNRGEVPETFWEASMEVLSGIEELRKVVIESRAPFIKRESIAKIRGWLRKGISLEVSIGVESSNESIRNSVIKKDLSWEELQLAMETVGDFRNQNVTFQTYLLVKPQTLSEREAIEDAVQSAVDVANLATKANVPTRIAFEPVFVTHGTELEKHFLAGQYTPVNLWSVLEVVQRTHFHPQIRNNPNVIGIFVGMSDEQLSAGRLASSCPKCQAKLLAAIETYNATQDPSELLTLSCTCKPTSVGAARDYSLELLADEITVLQFASDHFIGSSRRGWDIVHTADELSVILPTAQVSEALGTPTNRSDGWKRIKLRGEWDFDQVGVLANITSQLAAHHISILPMASWKTDYLVVKESQLPEVRRAFAIRGWALKE